MPRVVTSSPTIAQRMAELLSGFADLGNYARYGVDADTKYRMALTGAIPGAKPVLGEADVPVEERRAAGYLFGKRWPSVGVPLTQLANLVRSPFEDPIMYQTAVQAAEQGAATAQGPTLAEALAGVKGEEAKRTSLGRDIFVQTPALVQAGKTLSNQILPPMSDPGAPFSALEMAAYQPMSFVDDPRVRGALRGGASGLAEALGKNVSASDLAMALPIKSLKPMTSLIKATEETKIIPKKALLIPWVKEGKVVGWEWETPGGKTLSREFLTREEALVDRPSGFQHLDEGHQPLPEDVAKIVPRSNPPVLKQVRMSSDDSLVFRFTGEEPMNLTEFRALTKDYGGHVEKLGLDAVFDTRDTQKFRITFDKPEKAREILKIWQELGIE